MQSLIRHFVENFVLFQKHGGGYSKFCLCETLQPAATIDVMLMC